MSRVARVRGVPVLGSALTFARDTLGFLDRAAQEHGDLFCFRLLGRDIHVLSHPDDIERVLVRDHAQFVKDRYTRDLSRVLGDGLVTSDGEHWRKQRKRVSHAFTPARIRGYGDTMLEVAVSSTRDWSPDSIIDTHSEMTRITLEVVAQTLFGAGVSTEDVQVVGDAMRELSDFSTSVEAALLLPHWVPTPRTLRGRRGVARIDAVLYRIIGQARAGGTRNGAELLSALLDGQDDAGSGMTDRELRDECVTLFLAGHETTALALTYSLFLLATHPDVETRWRTELEKVCGGHALAASDAEALELTQRIVKEAMRIYPPVWAIGRQALEPWEIRGQTLPAGSEVALCQWITQRDSRWFPDPAAFDPERWTESRSQGLPRFAYFPFGGGPRVCIGNHFAMLEATLLLAELGRRFHFELVSGDRLELQAAVTLRPAQPIRMRLRARN